MKIKLSVPEFLQVCKAIQLRPEKILKAEFNALGKDRGHYTVEQKDYAINKAISIGNRAISRLLNVPRRTIQRWLKAEGN